MWMCSAPRQQSNNRIFICQADICLKKIEQLDTKMCLYDIDAGYTVAYSC